MLFKVTAVHVYSHQNDGFDQIENCKVCDVAVENQNAEHLDFDATFYETPQPEAIAPEPFSTISQSVLVYQVHFRLFGRPPPTLG